MTKITFVVIAVLVFIASVSGSQAAVDSKEEIDKRIKAAIAELNGGLKFETDAVFDQKEKGEKVKALVKFLELNVANENKSAKGKVEINEAKQKIEPFVQSIKAATTAAAWNNACSETEITELKEALQKALDASNAKTSDVSQSAPSMMIAAFVVIAFLMN